MKKIFTIISAVISALIVAFLVTISYVKTGVAIEYNEPKYVLVFDRSTTSTQSNGYTDEDEEYHEVLKKLQEVSNISILNRLVNNSKINVKVKQDLDKTYTKWNTSLKQTNIIVELIYDRQQDVIVYVDGHSKVVSYFCLAYVIPLTGDFSEMVIYYSGTNGEGKDESYTSCDPLVIDCMAGEFIEYIDSI